MKIRHTHHLLAAARRTVLLSACAGSPPTNSRRPPPPASPRGRPAATAWTPSSAATTPTATAWSRAPSSTPSACSASVPADKNGDGVLSEEEYVAEYEGRLKKQYFDEGRQPDKAYENSIKQAHVRFGIVNRARDGKFTAAEGRGHRATRPSRAWTPTTTAACLEGRSAAPAAERGNDS